MHSSPLVSQKQPTSSAILVSSLRTLLRYVSCHACLQIYRLTLNVGALLWTLRHTLPCSTGSQRHRHHLHCVTRLCPASLASMASLPAPHLRLRHRSDAPVHCRHGMTAAVRWTARWSLASMQMSGIWSVIKKQRSTPPKAIECGDYWSAREQTAGKKS